MSDITKEEIIKFWEDSGFVRKECNLNHSPCDGHWETEDGLTFLGSFSLPEITLDNIFKYAIKKAIEILSNGYCMTESQSYRMLMERWIKVCENFADHTVNLTPEALFHIIRNIFEKGV